MVVIAITAEEREQLETWVSDPETPRRLRTRARVVLALASGLSDREVARQEGVARQTVSLWRHRVVAQGSVLTITEDAPGRGRKPSVPARIRTAIRHAHEAAKLNGTPRSIRDIAREFSLSAATVHRALKGDTRPAVAPRPAGDAGPAGDTPDPYSEADA